MTVTEIEGAATCVQLQGRLDAAGADRIGLRFTAALAGAGQKAVIDLSGVDFIASLGIRMLISAARTLNAKGGALALYGAGEMVQGVFDDAALDQLIPIVATQAEAVAAVGV
jgi:anti-anti-sigma factor